MSFYEDYMFKLLCYIYIYIIINYWLNNNIRDSDTKKNLILQYPSTLKIYFVRRIPQYINNQNLFQVSYQIDYAVHFTLSNIQLISEIKLKIFNEKLITVQLLWAFHLNYILLFL